LISFTKMEGAGNNFIFLNQAQAEEIRSRFDSQGWIVLVRAICDRHKGVGADGVVILTCKQHWTMEIFNADGSLAGMCGNATRCAALYLRENEGFYGSILSLDTADGIKEVTLLSDSPFQARVNLGQPRFLPRDIPVNLSGENVLDRGITLQNRKFIISAVSMGNPHCVIFSDVNTKPDEDIFGDDFFLTWGSRLEKYELFPEGSNVEFVQILSPSEVKVRVWERGCGETQACGTGGAAIYAAGTETGRLEKKIICHMPGGDLLLERTDRGIFKTGPASTVFTGHFPWNPKE
jgi:diaminopimelate epimerase